MEGDNFKKTNSAASSLLSDPPATPEEIARSYTTTSDNAFQGFDQPGDQVDISKADQLTFNGQHSPVGGPMEEYYSDNHRLAQKHEAIRDSPKSRKRAKKDEWEISYVTQNPKSPLTTAPLKSILSQQEAFDSLTPDQQSHLLAMMPNHQHIVHGSDGKAKISPNFLKYDADWSHALSRFQEDLSEGRNDPAWITQARLASAKRQNGDFDDFKDREYEEFWGVKQKIPNHLIAGMSSAVKLENLFRGKALLVGDTWVLLRKFSGQNGTAPTILEKEMTVIKVEDGFPTIAMPPGKFKMSNPDRQDIIMERITGPGPVERKAIDQYGISNPPNGNGWKTIRVLRKNQDLGTLWDIRQAFNLSEREGDFQASLNGSKGGAHRSTRTQQDEGYAWINPFCIVVQQVEISDNFLQPPQTIPVSAELQDALDEIADAGCKIFRVDYRIMISDGIPVPSRPDDFGESDDTGDSNKLDKTRLSEQWLLSMMEKGVELFPTAFTRKLAGENGWSLGHAHLGRNAMGAGYTITSHVSYYDGLMTKMDCNKVKSRRRYVPRRISTAQRSELQRLFIENPHYRKHQTVYVPQLQPDSPVSKCPLPWKAHALTPTPSISYMSNTSTEVIHDDYSQASHTDIYRVKTDKPYYIYPYRMATASDRDGDLNQFGEPFITPGSYGDSYHLSSFDTSHQQMWHTDSHNSSYPPLSDCLDQTHSTSAEASSHGDSPYASTSPTSRQPAEPTSTLPISYNASALPDCLQDPRPTGTLPGSYYAFLYGSSPYYTSSLTTSLPLSRQSSTMTPSRGYSPSFSSLSASHELMGPADGIEYDTTAPGSSASEDQWDSNLDPQLFM